MADLWDFKVVRAGNVQLTVPTWTVSGKVVNRGGPPDVDFTAGNSVSFPQVLGQLTVAQQDEFVTRAVYQLLQWKLNF